MTARAKKILFAGLAMGWVALTVPAQMAVSFGAMPLYFEADREGGQFLARGSDSASRSDEAGGN